MSKNNDFEHKDKVIEYKKIKEILKKHVGKNNPITSKKISEELGFPMEDTQSKCRKKIHETIKKFQLPVLSNSKGFFIAQNQEEVDKYNKNIDERIKGIEENKKIINKNWNNLQNAKIKKG